LRRVWKADGFIGNFVKFALLTGQRKDKYLTMRWGDVREGVWYIRTEAREKLTRVRPISLAQASRISGITPADLAVLLFYLG
jgi:integrase